MTRKQYGLAIENWSDAHQNEVQKWLGENFGARGTGLAHETNRWGYHYDYGLENLYMDEDVYIMYRLRWG